MIQKLNGITMPTRQGEVAFPFSRVNTDKRFPLFKKHDLPKKLDKRLDYLA